MLKKITLGSIVGIITLILAYLYDAQHSKSLSIIKYVNFIEVLFYIGAIAYGSKLSQFSNFKKSRIISSLWILFTADLIFFSSNYYQIQVLGNWTPLAYNIAYTLSYLNLIFGFSQITDFNFGPREKHGFYALICVSSTVAAYFIMQNVTVSVATPNNIISLSQLLLVLSNCAFAFVLLSTSLFSPSVFWRLLSSALLFLTVVGIGMQIEINYNIPFAYNVYELIWATGLNLLFWLFYFYPKSEIARNNYIYSSFSSKIRSLTLLFLLLLTSPFIFIFNYDQNRITTFSLIVAVSMLMLQLFTLLFESYFVKLSKLVMLSGSDVQIGKVDLPPEFFNIYVNNLKAILKLKNEKQALAEKMNYEKKFYNISKQVAHDIRSPLSALNMVLRDANELPEDKRLLVRSAIQRITDIANNLMAKSKQNPPERPQQLISGILEHIVTEKRLQYKDRNDVDIRIELSDNSYGLFAQIDPVEIKRILSNLINNSVEALASGGLVTLRLQLNQNNIEISVEDNGIGIPPEIIPKIGNLGFTYGKENMDSGTGMGLHHCFKTVEEWGGSVKIESKLNRGTKIILNIPRAPSPKWFIDKIELHKDSQLAILDDDPSIHHIWDQRLKTILPNIKVLHFFSPEALISYQSKSNNISLFLCDYELSGHELTGLDLIRQLEIANKSLLITSFYEEPAIMIACEKMGIGLIPKSLAYFVPITIKTI